MTGQQPGLQQACVAMAVAQHKSATQKSRLDLPATLRLVTASVVLPVVRVRNNLNQVHSFIIFTGPTTELVLWRLPRWNTTP